MSDGQGFRPTKGTTPARNSRGSGTTPTTSPSGTRPRRGTSHRQPLEPFGLRTCASPHARTHAGWLWFPASFPLRILARWACDVGLSDERARAASGGDAPRHRGSHIARAHVSAHVRTPLLFLRMWVAALPDAGYTGSGAWLPRCARGGGYARLLRGSAARRA